MFANRIQQNSGDVVRLVGKHRNFNTNGGGGRHVFSPGFPDCFGKIASHSHFGNIPPHNAFTFVRGRRFSLEGGGSEASASIWVR